MSGRWIYGLYGILVVAFAVWLYGQFNSDERRLRNRLDDLVELVEKDAPESDLVAANKGRQLGNLLSRDFEINLLPFNRQLRDRAELGRAMVGYRRSAERIAVTFRDVEIELQSAGIKRAQMAAVAAVRGTVDGQRRSASYRFAFGWVEENGVWRIEQAELVEVIEGLL